MFAGEIARLQAAVARDTQRFAVLGRGRRLARAAEAVRVARRGWVEPVANGGGTLSDAEALLARLQERQTRGAAALDLLDEASRTGAFAHLDQRLAEAGFGGPYTPCAAGVLARLRHAAPEAGRS